MFAHLESWAHDLDELVAVNKRDSNHGIKSLNMQQIKPL